MTTSTFPLLKSRKLKRARQRPLAPRSQHLLRKNNQPRRRRHQRKKLHLKRRRRKLHQRIRLPSQLAMKKSRPSL